MKNKLTKKEVFVSILTYLISTAVIILCMFLMLVLSHGSGIITFVKENINGIITVFVSVCVLTMITYCYFFFENKAMLANVKKTVEIFFLFCIAFVVNFVVGKYVGAPAARPLLFFVLMAAMLLRRRDAIFINVVFALTLFIFDLYANRLSMSPVDGVAQVESFCTLLVVFCGGIVSIFTVKRAKTRIASVMVTFVLLIPTIIINVILRLSEFDEWTIYNFTEILIYGALNCIFSVLLYMFFLPVFEALFSELTPFRLRELTSDNAKLMKKLKTNAFGTYNHSIVVAQLAEACASAIGEDPELARAAAYYHDVGKLKNPEMFTENQSDYDLHKELTPELSVDIIRAHARDGAKLIKKHRLPDFFADVAVEHHGTLPIKYFYAKALNMSDGELNASSYSYSGPTPTSKIAAIIMIADASEAATRSLTDRSPEKVEALVNNIVEERMNMDQFVECNITMHELTVISRTVVNSLTGVYHSRVKYPKLTLSKKKK